PLVASDATAPEVERASRRLVADLAELSGVDDARLETRVLTRLHDTWYVRFDRRLAGGAEVLGAYAELRLVAGDVVLIRLETHPGAESAAPRLLTATQAVEGAHQALSRWIDGQSLVGSAREVIVPIADGGGWSYRPAFEVE